jgi:hypothetical protein
MAGKQTSSPSSPHKSIAAPPPPSSPLPPSVVIDDGVYNSFRVLMTVLLLYWLFDELTVLW